MAMNVNDFNAALEQLEVAKGISKETALTALKEAMIKGFKKDIGDDDAIVEVNIDLEKGIIDMWQSKTVVEDPDDELLEISLEDANANGGKYKLGDEYQIHASIENLRKAIVLSIKSILRQKFAEAEKEILYEQFKDKIGTLITGRVEQYDDHGATISVGRTSVYLSRKQMIKDESFKPGDPVRIFVNDVSSSTKGASIMISRSCEGFLKALMTETITDIYNGTIIIESIAREAGERSKVAVYSKDPNVDPAGTCIGPNGTRIQKVVSELGNGSSKEKIDIIPYTTNTPLYIMDALKPAKVLGIKFDAEKKSAIVVVSDDSFSLAIGRKGVNARLAVKLTGYNIDVKVESAAIEAGLEYMSYEEAKAIQETLDAEHKAEMLSKQEEEVITSIPGVPDGYVAPQARVYDDEANDLDAALEEAADKEEPAPVVEPAKEEPLPEAEPVKEEPAPEVTEVKTTTTLEDLEKSLENKKGNGKKSSNNRRKKKEEEEEEKVTLYDDSQRLSIYTDEELEEIEAEEAEDDYQDDEDDVDYDEYDQYYDEN